MNRLSKLSIAVAVCAALAGCQTNQKVAFDPTADETRSIYGKKNIYFDFDSSAIRADAKKTIGMHVAYMESNSAVALTIQGSADAPKPNPHDQKLALARANAVRDALVRAGIDAKRIEVAAVIDTESAKPGRDASKGRRAAFLYR